MGTALVLLVCAVAGFLPETKGIEQNGERKLLGYRVSRYKSLFPYTYSDDMMIPELAEGTEVTLRIIGHLSDVAEMALTSSADDCSTYYQTSVTTADKESPEVASVTFTTPTLSSRRETLYFCFKSAWVANWKHQGRGYWAKLIVVKRVMTFSTIVGGIALCVVIAGLMNASLLSLMSLDIAQLKARAENGTEKDKIICKALMGLRKRGYLITMAFIPGIVFFKTILTVLFRCMLSGWLTVVVASLVVVLMVEVAPRLRKSTQKDYSTELQDESSITSKYKEDDIFEKTT